MLQLRSVCADLEKYLLRVLWYLPNSRVTQFSRDTHPWVHGCHGNAKLLHGYYNDTVRNTWKDTPPLSIYFCHFIIAAQSRGHFMCVCVYPWDTACNSSIWGQGVDVELQQSSHPDSTFYNNLVKVNRTHWWRWRHVWSRDSPQCWETAGGTGTALVLPQRAGTREVYTTACLGTNQTGYLMFSEQRKCVSSGRPWLYPDLSSSWFTSSSFRCWDSIFFSRARWIQARACPTSDRPSLIVWINLEDHPRNEEDLLQQAFRIIKACVFHWTFYRHHVCTRYLISCINDPRGIGALSSKVLASELLDPEKPVSYMALNDGKIAHWYKTI